MFHNLASLVLLTSVTLSDVNSSGFSLASVTKLINHAFSEPDRSALSWRNAWHIIELSLDEGNRSS